MPSIETKMGWQDTESGLLNVLPWGLPGVQAGADSARSSVSAKHERVRFAEANYFLY